MKTGKPLSKAQVQKIAGLLVQAFAGNLPKIHQAAKAAGYSDGVVGSQADVATFFGCHTQSVKGWVADGMPHEKKHYDLRKIVQWWFERAKGRVGSDNEVQVAKQRKIMADADNAELKAQKTRRELVPVAEAKDVLSRLGSALAEQLQILPDKDPTLSTEQRASLRVEISKFLNGFKVQGEKTINEQFKPID
jgi:phage terminase Nu1 subunit (DNA packaging protein)